MQHGFFRKFILAASWIAGVGAMASTAPASADDRAGKASTAVAGSWTGFYLGAHIGGGWGSQNVDHTANDFDAAVLFGGALPGAGGAPAGSPSLHASGALGGVQAGYNWQLNRSWLVGFEADFDWSGIKGSGSNTSLPFGLSALAKVDEQIKWFGTVRARFGYLPTPNLLTYVTGGFAYGQVQRTASYINTSGVDYGASGPVFGIDCLPGVPVCATGSSSKISTGWTAGTGFEYGFWKNMTLKVEYMYVDLGRGSVTETAVALCCGATALSSFNANFHTTFNVARVGMNYRF